jgi:hypothetical protein
MSGAVLSRSALSGMTGARSGGPVKGSTIARHLASLEKHVAELRWLMIFVAAVATVTQAMAVARPGTTEEASPWPVIALIATIFLALGTAIEGIWGIRRVRARHAREGRELELHKALVSVLVEVSKVAGLDVDVPGANVWSIYTKRKEEPSLFREAHERLSGHPQMSDRAWTQGKGVIGRCWKSESPKFQDWSKLQSKFAGKTEVSEAAWGRLSDGDRWGFEREEYLDMIGKYQQIIAVPITDSQGKMLGCLSVDIPADRPSANPRCLDTAEVRLVLGTAAQGLRSLMPSSTV